MLYAADESAAESAAQRAFARIADLDGEFSDYRADSEISRLARSAVERPAPVSADVLFILKRSQELSAASDGAFDVTVGPLVALWRASKQSGELPEAGALAAARERVGWQLVGLDEANSTVRLARAGVALDFGGIVKGYAARQAVECLRAQGSGACLVALAGDVAAGDPPPGRAGWAVAIVAGEDGDQEGVLLLSDAAVSTSGDALQHVEVGGRRFSHIVDPRTGLGLENRLSATVVATRGEDADAIASALCVLGVERSLALLADLPDCAAILRQERDGAVERTVIDPHRILRWKAPRATP